MLRHTNMLFPRIAMFAGACACVAACGASTAARPTAGTASGERAACARSERGGFALSLAKTTGGEATAVGAAERFIRTGGIWSSPQHGWRVTSEDKAGVTLMAGASSVHAVQLADATWAVDSGHRC